MHQKKIFGLFISASILVICSATVYGDQNGAMIQQNVDTLIRTNACAGCNLSGADLNRMNLSGADLTDADLSEASFFLGDLSGANLSGANLRGAKFGGADLANADLRGADLRGAMLDGAYLEGSIMGGTVLEKGEKDPDLDAEITEKIFIPDESKPKEVMDQKKVAFADDQEETEAKKNVEPAQEAPPVKTITPVQQLSIGAKEEKKVETDNSAAAVPAPQESELSAAKEKVEAAAAPVKDSKKEIEESVTEPQQSEPSPEAPKVAFEEIIEKLLDQKRCYNCNLSGVNLSGKDLSGADLEGSDLSGAILIDTDLAGANLKGVSLQGAQLKKADLRKADLYKADLSNADLTDADFRGTHLDEADFSGAQGYQPPVVKQ